MQVEEVSIQSIPPGELEKGIKFIKNSSMGYKEIEGVDHLQTYGTTIVFFIVMVVTSLTTSKSKEGALRCRRLQYTNND